MELDALTNAYLQQLSTGTNYVDSGDRLASRTGLIAFYKGQLRKFNKVGLGKRTEFDVMVTPELIAVTIRRLEELSNIRLPKTTA
tara:strand:- start:259 stop:513 length:255 start_codon:yes stop_codon:yes gene_type:complete